MSARVRAYRWALVVAYDGPFGARGAVVSRHTTYAMAGRAESKIPDGCHNWIRIKELDPITGEVIA